MKALTVFTDPATGDLRLASGSGDRSVRIWDLAAGGAALFVLKGHTGEVRALTAFADPATGETRLASGSARQDFAGVGREQGGAALRVVHFDDNVSALAVRARRAGSSWLWGEAVGGVAHRERHDATDARMLSRVTSTR